MIMLTGFYRVNYDKTNWALITRALRSNPKDIHEFNRAQVSKMQSKTNKNKIFESNSTSE